ncbi:rRNA biogenesis protein rrp5 [Desulfosporosinus sp. Sb-LF]|uniref:rRNA biogenesis protein rrp5 n=1 Tax=Desulfosporosinus sp. Sb-LF TaxID=2560027 RepID=UPI00107FA771|nr:rRNA biogenesis protein rrp5 [Desulfosporosinus sp. Sb-LF]TGE31308.1 rRNA biogenesis protein rrp5 [Desulfosporosinus sp. Sb-LF]
MSKLEITLKYDELISAMTRLTEALETKQALVQVAADKLAEVVDPPSEAEQLVEVEPPPKDEKTVTLEQVRAVLTAKSQAGKKAAIQGLFKKFDADKLTAVDPTRYSDLLKEAEAL